MINTVDSCHPLFEFGHYIAECKKRHLPNSLVLHTSYWEVELDGTVTAVGSNPQFLADYFNAGLHKRMVEERLWLGTMSWSDALDGHVEHTRWLREWDLAHRPTHLNQEYSDNPLTCFDLVGYYGDRWMIGNVAAWLPRKECQQHCIQRLNLIIQANMESRYMLNQMKQKYATVCQFHTTDNPNGELIIPPPDRPGDMQNDIETHINSLPHLTMENGKELTTPQYRILCLVAMHLSNEDISKYLKRVGAGSSISVIRAHKKNLMKKLGLHKLSGEQFWRCIEKLDIPKVITPIFTSAPVSLLPATDN